jgi:alpha-mannosidase
MQFEVPASLAPDRRSRAADSAQLEVALTATLHAGLDRVDFIADVTNRARDHRFRAALRTPIVATDAVHDTSFGVLRRPLAPTEPRGTEDIYPTVPHRTFTALEGAELSAALVSRGILEVEARPERAGSTILLTLLRCVGWLSRSDLATRRGGAGPELGTPDAQEPGEHRFEFAVTTFRGSYVEGDLLQQIEAYTLPPRIFPGRRDDRDSAMVSLLSCNNPRVIFSTARPLGRAKSYKVRVYSASPNPESARFTFHAGHRARLVDLAGRHAKRTGVKRSRDGAITLELKPSEVVTFEVHARPR